MTKREKFDNSNLPIGSVYQNINITLFCITTQKRIKHEEKKYIHILKKSSLYVCLFLKKMFNIILR